MPDKSAKIKRQIARLEQQLRRETDPHEQRNIRRKIAYLQRQLRPGWGSQK